MPADFISSTLSSLAAASRTDTERFEILRRASQHILRQPTLMAQLVARICASEPGDEDLDGLVELQTSALSEARMAVEGGQSKGQEAISAAQDALDLALSQGALDDRKRQHLIRAWLSSGLEAPQALAFDPKSGETAPQLEADIAGALDDMLAQLERDSQGDPLIMHDMFGHLFAGLASDEERYGLTRAVLAQPQTIYEDMACFWLLDTRPAVQDAACDGLAERLERDLLSQDTYFKLVLMRPWLVSAGLRAKLDKIITLALRKGVGVGERATPWTITSAISSLIDGAGAQSIALFLSAGKTRAVAMLLLKQGHGIKDAYLVPCDSAKEQEALRTQIASELEPYAVSASYCADALSLGLGDGIMHAMAPAPGTIEVALGCGFDALRPLELDAREYLASLGVGQEVAGCSAQKRGRLINKSKTWPLDYRVVETWFEDSDDVRSLLGQSEERGIRATKSALWDWFETRRDYWATICARMAAILESSRDPDAASFAATAFALLNKRDLKKIPAMAIIFEQTIAAWLNETDGLADPTDLSEAVLPEAQAETPGELDRLLEGGSLSAAWVVGYISAAYLAPNRPDINQVLTKLLNEIMASGVMAFDRRLLDLVVLRLEQVSELIDESPDRLAEMLATFDQSDACNWARGFCVFRTTNKRSWPASRLNKDDKAILRAIEAIANTGDLAVEAKFIATWAHALATD